MKTSKQHRQRTAEDHAEDNHVLTQQELVAWWPFTRLDPKRFPKTQKADPLEGVEEALM